MLRIAEAILDSYSKFQEREGSIYFFLIVMYTKLFITAFYCCYHHFEATIRFNRIRCMGRDNNTHPCFQLVGNLIDNYFNASIKNLGKGIEGRNFFYHSLSAIKRHQRYIPGNLIKNAPGINGIVGVINNPVYSTRPCDL